MCVCIQGCTKKFTKLLKRVPVCRGFLGLQEDHHPEDVPKLLRSSIMRPTSICYDFYEIDHRDELIPTTAFLQMPLKIGAKLE